MLGGPVNATDYFDPSMRGSFPTPNESSLRTGLTPGGGGSMFPAPSPNSQAMYQHMANGGATPVTLDFHRTAMNAAAARKDSHKVTTGATSQPQEKRAPVAPMDASAPPPAQPPAFGQHDNDAANGLYMLAQASNGPTPTAKFAVPNPPGAGAAAVSGNPGRSHETSPRTIQRVGTGGSIGESLSGSAGGVSEISGEVSDSGDQTRPTTRARGKRAAAATKPAAPNNARRKTGDTPVKPPPAKRPKTTSNLSNNDLMMDMEGMDSDEENNIKEEQYHENGKKMTDEEKRKNFLERNRWVSAAPVEEVRGSD